jgi:hypothetical protein
MRSKLEVAWDANADSPVDEAVNGVETGGTPPHPPFMDMGERLARVESGLDWIKVILALIGALLIGGFTFFGVRFDRLDAKIDSIPQRLSEEFRAMRAEMAAQTNAIANSITATRQAQPPTLPQIIVIPDHSAPPTPEPPKP